jgi:hypothetical protein
MLTKGKTTQQSIGSWERGWMVMARSQEGCAMGRGGVRRRFIFTFFIEKLVNDKVADVALSIKFLCS